MSSYDYDVIIIGSGPGGEGAAMKLTKERKKVAVVEEFHKVGGGCTHWGTIPSKALRQSIQALADYRRNPLFQHKVDRLRIDYPDLLKATSFTTSHKNIVLSAGHAT